MKGSSRGARRQSLVMSPSVRNGGALLDASDEENKTPTKKISPVKNNKISPSSLSNEKKDNGRQSISPLTPSKVNSYDNKVLKAYMNNQLELNESEMKYYEDVVDSLAEELNNVKQEKGTYIYFSLYFHSNSYFILIY